MLAKVFDVKLVHLKSGFHDEDREKQSYQLCGVQEAYHSFSLQRTWQPYFLRGGNPESHQSVLGSPFGRCRKPAFQEEEEK